MNAIYENNFFMQFSCFHLKSEKLMPIRTYVESYRLIHPEHFAENILILMEIFVLLQKEHCAKNSGQMIG
ncbi:hypothetical protein SAMN05661091_5240 [Paenibacillus uliginis N3/975]|uniref:Uncharacterized protein n=1 Tax=Paenibacillus uliginis N3/975 TaxID=1313296 RepID=A0A1X7HPT9_9BACL|nr:hypothetical protein SAMN05661091_5240 [Paenibacillus uliginis N3/975]